jgi:hypothetical protein
MAKTIVETIKKVDGKWVVYSKMNGKRLGTHDTEEQAKSQLRAIEASKDETHVVIMEQKEKDEESDSEKKQEKEEEPKKDTEKETKEEPQSKKTNKSLSVIDVLDNGNIYIEIGSKNNLITQLGKSPQGQFKPYTLKIKNVVLFYPYQLSGDYIPANYETIDDFINILETQVQNNEYVRNYVRIGAQNTRKYLRQVSLLDSGVKLLQVKNTILGDLYSTYFADEKIDAVVSVKNAISPEDLSIADDAPSDVKSYFDTIIAQVNREDRDYSIDDMSLKQSELKYFDGYIDYSDPNLSEISKGTEVILITDYVSSASNLMEVMRWVEKQGAHVVACTCLGQKI